MLAAFLRRFREVFFNTAPAVPTRASVPTSQESPSILDALRVTHEMISALFGVQADPALSPGTPDADMAFLRDFLRGKKPEGNGRIWPYDARSDRPARAVLSGGGYELLFRIEEGNRATYLLNMDHPLALLPVPEWRERAVQAAGDVGAELLPLSETAYRRVAIGGQRPRLVHRQEYEAVFAVADKYYLSGYDEQETPPLYFLCRLPHAVSTIDEARESLKPESVRLALESGATVKRQGDLFFIETGLEDEDVKLAVEKIIVGGENATRRLYGTAHYADGVARLPNGAMLAKGIICHAPALVGQRRGPDHSALELGDAWCLVARNAVPAERRTERVVDPFADAAFDPPGVWFAGLSRSTDRAMREAWASLFDAMTI